MKKLLLICIALTVSLSASAQFKLTPFGFINAENRTKTYVEKEMPEMSQEEIFNSTMLYLQERYGNVAQIHATYGIYITINVCSSQLGIDNMVLRNENYFRGRNAFVQRFSMTFRMKDGKLRINAPVIRNLALSHNRNLYQAQIFARRNSKKRTLYRINGTPVAANQEIIKGLENYFNEIVNEAAEYIPGES